MISLTSTSNLTQQDRAMEMHPEMIWNVILTKINSFSKIL